MKNYFYLYTVPLIFFFVQIFVKKKTKKYIKRKHKLQKKHSKNSIFTFFAHF